MTETAELNSTVTTSVTTTSAPVDTVQATPVDTVQPTPVATTPSVATTSTISSTITVSTTVLQDLVSRAVKGSTMVEIIPLSCLMEIKIKDKKMTVKTTDNVNYVTTFAEVDTPDFEMVVQSKIFAATVAKLSTTHTTLTIQGNKVLITANGKYNVPLATDADGSKIVFPEYTFTPVGTTYHLNPSEVRSILTLNKSCKADTKETPSIYNYYMDSEHVLTTNMFKGCNNPIKMFDSPVCLPPNLVDLIPEVLDESGVDVSQDENSVMFESTKGTLYGKKCLPADLESFPITGLLGVFENDIQLTTTVNKTMLMNALDRMILFVDAIEYNKLILTFTNESVNLHSESTGSDELVRFITPMTQTFEPISFPIDAMFLKSQLTACDKEDIVIKFSDEVGLQLKCDNVTLALAILTES